LIATALWGKESPEPMASAAGTLQIGFIMPLDVLALRHGAALETGGKARHGTNVVWPGDLKVRTGISS